MTNRDENGWKIGWSAIGTILQAVATIVALSALAYTIFAFQRALSVQAVGTALTEVQHHYEYAAEPRREPEMIAQHGLRTAHLVFDILEETGEYRQGTETARGLLERYKGTIDKEDFPCEEFDNEFVELAEQELAVDWCRCQAGGCEVK